MMPANVEKAGLMALAEARRRGIPVEKVATTLTREEQETSITFNRAAKVAEIATFDPRWMKALEGGLAIPPREVYVYTNCQCRIYEVPKVRMRPPFPKRNVTPETREKLSNILSANRPAAAKSRCNCPIHNKTHGHMTPQDFLFANGEIAPLLQGGELLSL